MLKYPALWLSFLPLACLATITRPLDQQSLVAQMNQMRPQDLFASNNILQPKVILAIRQTLDEATNCELAMLASQNLEKQMQNFLQLANVIKIDSSDAAQNRDTLAQDIYNQLKHVMNSKRSTTWFDFIAYNFRHDKTNTYLFCALLAEIHSHFHLDMNMKITAVESLLFAMQCWQAYFLATKPTFILSLFIRSKNQFHLIVAKKMLQTLDAMKQITILDEEGQLHQDRQAELLVNIACFYKILYEQQQISKPKFIDIAQSLFRTAHFMIAQDIGLSACLHRTWFEEGFDVIAETKFV